jgi:hypothetical protein
MEWVTILALLVGPILAVLVTRYMDDFRAKRERRMLVFRTLMRTRRMQLSADHVGALNLVEIEFHGEAPIIDAWKDYFSNLSGPAITVTTPQAEVEKFLRIRSNLLTKLLHALAKSLKFRMEQLDIFEGGYAPSGWFNDETQVREIRTLTLEVLRGLRALPITPLIVAGSGNPFPPAPVIDPGKH